jgi:hypothetical protein
MRLHEQNFAIQLLYRPKDTGLDVTLECVTPDPIDFLDISIEHDQDGFYTILYDKRDKMHAQGVMGAIQRFPNHDAAMSQQVLYGVVTSFLHRAYHLTTRRDAFATSAARRIAEMVLARYTEAKLVRKLKAFLLQHYTGH